MKKILLMLLSFMLCLTSFSQDVKQKLVYQYTSMENIDKNYNIVESLEVNGLIIYSEAGGLDFISVVMGEDIVYNGYVSKSKIAFDNSEQKAINYLVIMEFQGNKVPLQIFEIYEKDASLSIPQSIIVNIHSAQTGEYLQGQSFSGISRIR